MLPSYRSCTCQLPSPIVHSSFILPSASQMVTSLVYSALQALVLAGWSSRRTIFLLISCFNLMALMSSAFRHCASLVACKFLSYIIFCHRLSCKIIYLLLDSPHLYMCILLTLVILTIVVVNSSVLSAAPKPVDCLPVEQPNRLVEDQEGEQAPKIRVVSNLSVVEEIVRQQRQMLSTKDLISLENTARMILSSEEKEKASGASDTDNASVVFVIQRGRPSSDDLPRMEDPSFKVAVVTEGRNAAGHQLDEREDNQIGEAESSDDESDREELKRRADAFILKFRRNLWLQRQESYRRRHGFESEGA